MFNKYQKTYRIQTPNIEVSGKMNMHKKDVQGLLTGKVTIEEKIDGANVGIIGVNNNLHPPKPFRLQKRGSLIDFSEHEQYNRFKAWSGKRWDDLMKIPSRTYVYGEFMWATHHIYYDNLPDWFICFDIWDGKRFYNRQEKEDFCKELNLEIISLIYEGYIDDILHLESFVRGLSEYSTDHDREGIVVKNYRKQMRGKIVVPEFVKELNEDGTHWISKWDSRKVNKLREKDYVS
jgi:ATP-dependent RNA circularization protein (DNA/RNA ligase family)